MFVLYSPVTAVQAMAGSAATAVWDGVTSAASPVQELGGSGTQMPEVTGTWSVVGTAMARGERGRKVCAK